MIERQDKDKTVLRDSVSDNLHRAKRKEMGASRGALVLVRPGPMVLISPSSCWTAEAGKGDLKVNEFYRVDLGTCYAEAVLRQRSTRALLERSDGSYPVGKTSWRLDS